MSPRVSIIILNWNGWKDTLECLTSLYHIDYDNYEVIVVDNHSHDESVEMIEKYVKGEVKKHSNPLDYLNSNKSGNSHLKKTFVNKPLKLFHFSGEDLPKEKIDMEDQPTSLFLIENNKNYGFAGGNNVGMEFALKSLEPDYVLLLNNDTVVDKNFLSSLIKIGEKQENIGILGPKIFPLTNSEVNRDAAIIGSEIMFFLCGLTRGVKDEGEIEDVDLVSGSCMLIKRTLLDKIGLLDSTYFFGWEDADFCIKAKKSGYRVVGVPTAIILHKVGASYGDNFADNPQVLSEGIRNQLIFLNRHASISQRITSTILLPMYYLFLILYGNRNLTQVKSRLSAIKKGVKLYYYYKNSLKS